MYHATMYSESLNAAMNYALNTDSNIHFTKMHMQCFCKPEV